MDYLKSDVFSAGYDGFGGLEVGLKSELGVRLDHTTVLRYGEIVSQILHPR